MHWLRQRLCRAGRVLNTARDFVRGIALLEDGFFNCAGDIFDFADCLGNLITVRIKGLIAANVITQGCRRNPLIFCSRN